MNKQESARIVAVLAASFPSTTARLTEGQMLSMVDVFAEMLSDLPYAQVNAAVALLVQTGKFMPSVAEIRAAALELSSGKRKTGAEAWTAVVRAMRDEGAWRVPGEDFTFSDPLTRRCVQDMGWTYLCTSENTVADRARFIELYEAVAADKHQRRLSPVYDQARGQLERGGPVGIASLIGDVLKRGDS